MPKSHSFSSEMEYLWYLITKEGIKPVQKKIQTVLDFQPPTTLNNLRHFLKTGQFHEDIWNRRNRVLSPFYRPDGKGNGLISIRNPLRTSKGS